MKIKLQEYSLISNEWIEERIKKLNKSYTHSNIIGNVIRCNFINDELEYLEELKQQLIPLEKLVDNVYDELIGCSGNIVSEKLLYDQRKQDYLNSEIEIQ
jgi:hypothetical protein